MSSIQCMSKLVQSLSLASVSFGSDTEQRSSLTEQECTNTLSSTRSALEKCKETCKLELALVFSAI